MEIYKGSHYCLNYQVVLLDKGGDESPTVNGENVKAFINDAGVIVLTANDADISVSVFSGNESVSGQNVLNGEFKVTDGLLVGSVITGDTAEINWPNGTTQVSVYVNSDEFEKVTEVNFILASTV